MLPIKRSQIPIEIAAGLTLAALAIPEVMDYTKISGTPVITGLYTMLIPMLLFAFIGPAFMADFLPRSVLVGFLTGVGMQVALGQISGMLGLEGGGHGPLQKIWADIQQLEQINYNALGVALAVPGGMPHLRLPDVDWSLDLVRRLAPIAFAMCIVILAQGAATSRAYAARYNESLDQNADLNAIGLTNIGAGLSGTFVVAGSPTKTQMVDSAGGRSQLSHLTAVGVVLLALLFFTAPLAYMPESVLAAVVFLIGFELINIEEMKNIYRQRRSEFWVAVITALTVVFVGVEQGILLAIVLSMIDHTRHGYQPKTAVLERTDSGRWVSHPVASNARPFRV